MLMLKIISLILKGSFVTICICVFLSTILLTDDQRKKFNDEMVKKYPFLSMFIPAVFYGGLILCIRDVFL